MKFNKRNSLLLIMLIGITCLTILLSLVPKESFGLQYQSMFDPSLNHDKVLHFIVYFFITFIILFLTRRVLLSFFLASFLGLALEIIQEFALPHREFSVLDMLANCLGTSLAAGIFYLVIHLKKQPPNNDVKDFLEDS